MNTDELEARLQELETRYQMPSNVFYAKYTRGQLKEATDFIRWAGLMNRKALSLMNSLGD